MEYIKSIVHSAKVYVRPLQKPLDLTAVPSRNVRIF